MEPVGWARVRVCRPRGAFATPGGRRVYINAGLGFLRQVRFNVRPEVTVFTLRRA